MARPYSLNLRDRVVAAVAAGESCRKVAATYKVSVASVVKWSQRFRTTGSAGAKRMGGHRPRSLAGEQGWLLARLAAVPDLTLRALVAELGERLSSLALYSTL
jgi:transposase